MEKIDPGPGYRLLEVGEPFTNHTEVWTPKGTWVLYVNHKASDGYGYPKAAREPINPQDAKPTVDPGEGYRLLEVGEVIPSGSEFWLLGTTWVPSDVRFEDAVRFSGDVPYRVKVPPAPKDTDQIIAEVSDLVSKLDGKPDAFQIKVPKDPSTKYHRAIYGAWNDPEVHEDAQGRKYLNVDVYSVLAAFAPDHPTGHAVKKLLCAGNRDKGSKIQDLKEAIVAIEAAIYAAEVSG